MELKFSLSIKDLIVFILIGAIIFSIVVLYFRQGATVQANQVKANTQSIQAIVTFLNNQGQQSQIPTSEPEQIPVKK